MNKIELNSLEWFWEYAFYDGEMPKKTNDGLSEDENKPAYWLSKKCWEAWYKDEDRGNSCYAIMLSDVGKVVDYEGDLENIAWGTKRILTHETDPEFFI